MKLFVLGTGSIATHDITLSSGMSIAQFAATEAGGAEIAAAMRGPSPRIRWHDILGRIDWYDATSDSIFWTAA